MTRRWMAWGLVASVAANMAVVVAVVAAMLAGGPDGHRGGGSSGGPGGGRGIGGPPGMAALAHGLDRSQREALFRALRGDETLRAGRERMGAAEADVISALTADPFVPEAFEAALVVQRDLQGALAGRGIAALSAIVASLSPPERAAIALRIADRRHR